MNNTNLTVFAFESAALRSIHRDGEPWFVAKDVCSILQIQNPRDALTRLDEDEKDGVGLTDAIGRTQETSIINESGLYTLIMSSRKKEAQRFRKWVTSEVLPSIRKTGQYATTIDPKWIDIQHLIALGAQPAKAYAVVAKAFSSRSAKSSSTTLDPKIFLELIEESRWGESTLRQRLWYLQPAFRSRPLQNWITKHAPKDRPFWIGGVEALENLLLRKDNPLRSDFKHLFKQRSLRRLLPDLEPQFPEVIRSARVNTERFWIISPLPNA